MRGTKSASAGLVVLMLLGSPGCGEDAEDACKRVVESYARGWERCGRATYEDAHAVLSEAFVCSQQENVDESQLDRCIADIDALDCGAVGNGHQPSSCNGVVGD